MDEEIDIFEEETIIEEETAVQKEIVEVPAPVRVEVNIGVR